MANLSILSAKFEMFLVKNAIIGLSVMVRINFQKKKCVGQKIEWPPP